ncbi:testicular acid phosphatase homolog [Pectinophora gossypiella]|uniref:testicular acid phosphatase homolog n=1 Tax=Pectinophora gossypiella TaxID=13191 RepID=UPI00214E3CFC|nr:testicular acid phosphatase homolog [Pectinophora gossypiella]
MILTMLMFVSCEARQLWERAPEDGKLEGKVVQVHVVHGSGHAEPPACYPGDPHARAAVWKHGPGELTQHGRRQGFHFGENLRSRYLNLLPKERTYKYVKATSAKTTRYQMTSSVILAGLLSPKGDDIWSTVPWQPAVVNTDDILAKPKCDRLEQLQKELKYEIDSEQLYYYVSVNAKTSVKDPKEMLEIFTCLETQKQAGLALPAWTRGFFYQMKREAAKTFRYDNEVSRLEVGRILDTITKFNFSDKDNRINLYCTDSVTVGALMAALKLNQTESPNFLSAFVVEIRELEGWLHAQLWYRSGPNDELARMDWPDCGARCPLVKLRALLDPLIPKNWQKECALDQHKNNSANIMHLTLFLLTFLFVYVATASCNRIYEFMNDMKTRNKRSKKTLV